MTDIRQAVRKKRQQQRAKIDLSGPGQARTDDPDTAKDAANALVASTLRRDVVFAYVRAGDKGLNGDEMHTHVNRIRSQRGEYPVPRDSVVPRRPELDRAGLLEKHPDGMTRPGISGRSQEVWVATDFAKRIYNELAPEDDSD
jgi:hypothetical protein